MRCRDPVNWPRICGKFPEAYLRAADGSSGLDFPKNPLGYFEPKLGKDHQKAALDEILREEAVRIRKQLLMYGHDLYSGFLGYHMSELIRYIQYLCNWHHWRTINPSRARTILLSLDEWQELVLRDLASAVSQEAPAREVLRDYSRHIKRLYDESGLRPDEEELVLTYLHYISLLKVGKRLEAHKLRPWRTSD